QRAPQRSQWRGRRRRPQPQPVVELRCRGTDRRPAGPGTACPPAAQRPRHAAAVAGRADAARRRRDRPHAARQQQRLLPGQRRVVARLEPRRRARVAARVRAQAAAAAARAPGVPPPRFLPGPAAARQRRQGHPVAASGRRRDERPRVGARARALPRGLSRRQRAQRGRPPRSAGARRRLPDAVQRGPRGGGVRAACTRRRSVAPRARHGARRRRRGAGRRGRCGAVGWRTLSGGRPLRAARPLARSADPSGLAAMSGPTPRERLQWLAAAHGVEAHFHDIWGRRHDVSDSSLRALLGDLGVPADSDADVELGLATAHHRYWRRLAEPVIALAAPAQAIAMLVRLPRRGHGERIAWRLTPESGEAQHGAADVDALPLRERADVDGVAFESRTLAIPAGLPPGYHQLALRAGDAEANVLVIVAPAHCYRPSSLDDDARVWGWSVQLYGL